MNEQFDQLVRYIKQNLDGGYSEQQIRGALNAHNWNVELVERAFQSVIVSTPQPAHNSGPVVNFAQNEVQHVYHTQNGVVSLGTSEPVKYKVFRASRDAVQAIKYNFLSVIGAIFLCIIIGVIMNFVIALVLSPLFSHIGPSSSGSFIGASVFIIAILIVPILISTFSFAFLSATFIQTVYDGRFKRKSSVPHVINKSLSQFMKIGLVNTLVAAVMIWPLFLIMVLFIAALKTSESNIGIIFVLPIGVVLGYIWLIIAVLRYSLAPIVAIYEPDTPIRMTLKRSKELLAKGGQWFLLKIMFFTVLVTAIIGMSTGKSIKSVTSSGNNWILTILYIFLGILYNAVLVMLYINRSAVKSRAVKAQT